MIAAFFRTMLVLALVSPGAALAQATPPVQTDSTRTPTLPSEIGLTALTLSAGFGPDTRPVTTGLQWRLFDERAAADGSHAMVMQSADANPHWRVPDGTYVVHVDYGLASAMKRVSVRGTPIDERLALNAGALKIGGMLGDSPISPSRISLAIYVPERGNIAAKLVVADARPGTIMRLPEGNYRVISTYLEKDASGPLPASGVPNNATNSVVNADLRVQTGKLTEATLRHHAATLTLKLVNNPGGEALANTNFSVLTPGGDIIREMIGAFPSLVLAEGEYVVLARHNAKTYQSTFVVQTGLDRDVEVLAK